MSTLFRPNVAQDVKRRLGALQPDGTAKWGRMSAHQTVCHLSDAFRLVFGERPTELRGNLFMKTVARVVGLTLPVPWPKGVPTAPEVDQEHGGSAPTEFQADVHDLQALIDRFVEMNGRKMAGHPFFGILTRGEWGRWGFRHMDHHLRQFGV